MHQNRITLSNIYQRFWHTVSSSSGVFLFNNLTAAFQHPLKSLTPSLSANNVITLSEPISNTVRTFRASRVLLECHGSWCRPAVNRSEQRRCFGEARGWGGRGG